MSERPLTDLDAELRALLSVDASPEFAARVRMRIAGERIAPRWGCVPLSLGGLAAAVLVVAVVSRPAGAPAPVAPAPPLAGVGAPAIPSLPVPPWPDAVTLSEPRRPGAARRGPARGEPVGVAVASSPEAIVDPRQRTAIDALLALTNRGAVLEFVPAPASVATDIVVEPLNVPVLTVEPLPTSVGAERSDL
jgi:hypothetical protein